MAVPADRVIVALDILDEDRVLRLVDSLRPAGVEWFKVGVSLWIHSGRRVVDAIVARGGRVFLDLKLHDIPHQVGLATQAASSLGVDLLTVHASGGDEMMRAAAANASNGLRLLAITVLTSLEADPIRVAARAEAAHAAGIHGAVCSPLEAAALRARHPEPFLLVTPGVRPSWAKKGDQKRVATPEAALASGSSLLVIGRPITQADDPTAAALRIIGHTGGDTP